MNSAHVQVSPEVVTAVEGDLTRTLELMICHYKELFLPPRQFIMDVLNELSQVHSVVIHISLYVCMLTWAGSKSCQSRLRTQQYVNRHYRV